MAAKEKGDDVEGAAAKGDRVIYKIDVPANRYDLLCIEGIARAFLIFLGKQEPPLYRVVAPAAREPYTLTVERATGAIRPYCVSAVLRGVSFADPRVYASFIDLQDKLHQNICRRRSLVAIGTHDLATLKPPFRYRALPPTDIRFVPLSQEAEVDAAELMEIYRTDARFKHIKPYVSLIDHSPVYPVIYDADDVVLSVPPIINGEHSKITPATRDVFIECTATDLTKANIVLNTMVTMFSEYCTPDAFVVEPVNVVYEEEATSAPYTTPNLAPREATARISQINKIVGVDIAADKICALLDKMQLPAAHDAGSATVTVQVPPTRSDILHECDVVEDVAIAYGYNNLPNTVPKTVTVGTQQPMNHLTDLLRHECAFAGYTEVLTHALCSHDENFAMLGRKEEPERSAVVLSNPATLEFEIARTTLLPGLLKTLRENRAVGVRDGVKIFEISDVVTLAGDTDTGARNSRTLAAVYTGAHAGLEVIHGLVDKVMTQLGVRPTHVPEADAVALGGAGGGEQTGMTYRVEAGAEPRVAGTFFPGMAARIVVSGPGADADGLVVGNFGALHPDVLERFELKFPASIVELTLEPFV
uniref:phenylalanine--tRNA ligase n=1 Tax=Bicosoecida sp. CB-2014 TaxID=1486930 RepID=A0A7S1CP76_9STRA